MYCLHVSEKHLWRPGEDGRCTPITLGLALQRIAVGCQCSHLLSHLLALRETLSLVFEIGSPVVQVSLDLEVQLRLALSSRFFCYLSNARIIGSFTWTGSSCFGSKVWHIVGA